MRDPHAILHGVFGHHDFRGQQQEIVEHVIAGGDALVLMPTGAGKSLCYQVPALARPGTAVVVSPLIALMQDQVAALAQLGVEAAALNSQLEPEAARDVLDRLEAGRLDLLYLAPERLMQPGFLDRLARLPLALFAIDEAHCVSQWGHDFRPEYLALAELAQRFPDVPRLALTATADERTRAEVVERLALDRGRVFVAGFDRPNIRYRVADKNGPRTQLRAFLQGRAGRADGEAGIVYCLSRARVEEVAAMLAREGITALPYHAGLDREARAANQDRFLKEDGVVMVATVAFGMGIDKPDVRFVVHLDVPKSLEAYYQETGRAGRDGLPADVLMLYGMADVAQLWRMIEESGAPEAQKHVERQKLSALLGYAETTRCRRQVLLEYFGERAGPCGNCDTCLEPVEGFDGTVPAQKALSAIYRTGQRYGAGHIVDVLRGVTNDKVERAGHHLLPTFGIGAEYGQAQWRSILRQLAALGLVRIDVQGHGGLRLGEDVRPVLRGERPVVLRRDPGRRGTGGDKRPAGERALDDETDRALFRELKEIRLGLAREQNVPPYVIFHDSTLAAVARTRPRTLDALSTLPGVGTSKLGRYGNAILRAVESFEAR